MEMKNSGLSALLLLMAMALGMHIACHARMAGELHPVVLVPGSGGNQLEGRLNSAYKPSSLFCKAFGRGKEWFRLWFDPSVLLAPFTRCFAERMMLYYNRDADDYRNAPGVETRVPYFGSTEGLNYLDPHLKFITEYMASLVDTLEQIGYIDGTNLFGAPYDFRYGLASEGHPSQVGSKYLEDLKQLIESASSSNGGKPVIILSHSLGCHFTLQLLIRNSLSWRRKFVKHFIALSAPWGGAVQEMLTFASGSTLGIPIVDPLLVRAEQRSSESNLWLLPSPKLFGGKPLVIDEHKNKSYSAMDMSEFLRDIGFEEGVYPYKTRIMPLVDRLEAPGVPMTCMVGSGIETPETLFYGRDGFDVQPEIAYGDGDGTVNMISLLALQTEWSTEERDVLRVIKLPGVDHTSILKDELALNEIIREIQDINSAVLSFVS